ncbi:phage tail fiber protein [Rhizobium favelukesii]|uniref:Conserved protein n=1 Tax=Rhizobium favelukesii TaxID=348824 RepID=W6RFA7_9HYPH|nr:hypothetical protein [Rhizobium favelukesii]MCS0459322.1 hypothetical protein [Rhizobium favelukesii]CDM57378.1 putative conserved protein [Rhizobium favelukesii]
MASFTDYLENKILGHVFGGVPYTKPATLYVALFVTPTDDAGGGIEVTGTGYTRVAVAFSVAGNVASNSAEVVFPVAGGVGWSTVTHGAIFDAATGGNMLAQGSLAYPKDVGAGDVYYLPIGNLTLSLD